MASLELRIFGQPVHVETPAVAAQIRFDEALPFLYQLDDRLIALSVEHAAPGPVSCAKGCSACCRAQPVPVTPPEAYALARLVEALPEPRRSEIESRFAGRAQRLREAGLDGHFLERDPALTPQRAREIAREYFALGLACPFLEDDACGIYAQRPFVCRQYLVTSPAPMCANPFDNPVTPVKMAIAPATATLRASSAAIGETRYCVPLTLAMEYVARHRAELERTFPAEQVYRALLKETLAMG
jgi:Fe-S-cluster containining protein